MEGQGVPYGRMLDELVETGYTGTELGDWGYMPTDPAMLSQELEHRNLTMLAAFVPIAFKDRSVLAEGSVRAVKTASLLQQVTHEETSPLLVLADDNGTDQTRTAYAGRVTAAMKLDDNEWRVFADGVNSVARTVFEQTGLRTVFHHHGAGFVETPDEVERLLALTDPAYVGLVFDTGHYMLGGGDVLDGLTRFKNRIWYIHFKDYNPVVADRAAEQKWDYFQQVAEGVFCELGQGGVPFGKIVNVLEDWSYNGWICVEQDVLPGMGAPKESADRNRQYLKGLGL